MLNKNKPTRQGRYNKVYGKTRKIETSYANPCKFISSEEVENNMLHMKNWIHHTN